MEQKADYIERLCRGLAGPDQAGYIRESGPLDFVPVVDDDVARVLRLVVRLRKPKRILELGTSIGYAATSMAIAGRECGTRVTTVEFDTTVAARARENFARWGVADRVDLLVGDARDIVPRLDGDWDMIFLDIDKHLYPPLLEPCIRFLSVDGVLLADDTLFPVLDLGTEWEDLKAPVDEFNRMVGADARLEHTILPIGDGLTVAMRRPGL